VSAIQEIFRRFGPDFRRQHGFSLTPQQRKAMRDIERCRTEALGGQIYYCPHCDKTRYSYHSCRNRHCPTCQNKQGAEWLEQQTQRLLPSTHFMVTFTLPAQLRPLARMAPKFVYSMLFRCGADSLQVLLRDERFLGGEAAIVGVLHTWKRDLQFHPHVHFIVSGGGLSTDATQWVETKRSDFLIHVFPLRDLFTGKVRAALKRAGYFNRIKPNVWAQKWNVDCRPVGRGIHAFKYLAPYIFRVAISNKRIVHVDEKDVTFAYNNSKTGKTQRRTIAGVQFIGQFLQHVLPARLVKVRYYGLLSSTKRRRLEKARALLQKSEQTHNDAQPILEMQTTPQDAKDKTPPCPDCRKPMIPIGLIERGARQPTLHPRGLSRSPPLNPCLNDLVCA
jgi:hypothetical protein